MGSVRLLGPGPTWLYALPILQGRLGSQSLLEHREEVGAVNVLHLLPPGSADGSWGGQGSSQRRTTL